MSPSLFCANLLSKQLTNLNKIFKDVIIKNNLDPKAFKIEVTQGD